MSYRKSIFAAVLALPLVLSACGSDEEDTKDASASATSSSSAKTSASKSDADKKKEEEAKKAEDAKKAEEDKAAKEAGEPGQEGTAEGAEGDAAAQGAAAVPGIPNVPAPKPVEGGQPAGQADAEQITNMVQGLGNRDISGFMNYVVDNACPSYVAANGGEENMRKSADMMASAPQFAAVNGQGPTVNGVDDIQVNGDQASANVTLSYPQADAVTEVMPFSREGGKWTFCSQ